MVNIVNSLTGSTLDIQTLAKSLTDATRAPQQQLIDSRKTSADNKISSIGRIYAAANDIKTALDAYGDPKLFGYLPQTTNTPVASFSYSPFQEQSPVDLSLTVTQLATSNSVTLQSIGTSETLAGSGSSSVLKIFKTSNNDVLASFNLSEYGSIEALRDAVRKAGIGASILIKPDGEKALTISRGTGAANQFYVTTTNASGAMTDGLMVDSTSAASTGQDAKVTIGSDVYTSATNSFSSIMSGVNINVAGTGSVTLSSKANTDNQIKALRSVVSTYNDLINTVSVEVQYDKDVTKRGGLAKDFVARNFMYQMRRITTEPIEGLTGSVTLAELGVRTNNDGTLMIDELRLSSVVATQPDLIQNVMSSSPTKKGALEKMLGIAETVLGRTGPFVNLYQQTTNRDLEKIKDDQTKLDDQMNALQARYLKEFTAMQDVVQASKNSQESLTQAMAAWTAGLKNN